MQISPSPPTTRPFKQFYFIIPFYELCVSVCVLLEWTIFFCWFGYCIIHLCRRLVWIRRQYKTHSTNNNNKTQSKDKKNRSHTTKKINIIHPFVVYNFTICQSKKPKSWFENRGLNETMQINERVFGRRKNICNKMLPIPGNQPTNKA